ncbi:hypothetical protein KSZ_58950 [Dictyobacter formicarum]|uniref:Uncharacterized protein n=1 Tax=Dictyobacter formicarum TaxID=2778368 RepID=A0ABQ3VQA6_9CHLR|nr:hypothetical protein KSZ_58950 [Dictyobacter formicarum]
MELLLAGAAVIDGVGHGGHGDSGTLVAVVSGAGNGVAGAVVGAGTTGAAVGVVSGMGSGVTVGTTVAADSVGGTNGGVRPAGGVGGIVRFRDGPRCIVI